MATLPATAEITRYVNEIIGSFDPATECIRAAFKFIPTATTDLRHFDYTPRYDQATGERFYWLEKAYHCRDDLINGVKQRYEMAHAFDPANKLKAMIAPAVFNASSNDRKLSSVVRTTCVHIDYDAQHTGRMPRDQFQQLLRTRPLIVKSGTPGSFHAYWAGVDAISLDLHDRLARTLAQHFNADAKIRPNDLLGLPGTTNIKNDRQVRFTRRKDHTPRPFKRYADIATTLPRLLDVELVPSRFDSTTPLAPSPDSVDTTCLRRLGAPQMRQMIRRCYEQRERGNTDDLSRMNFFIIRLAHELGLTVDQTFMFMTTKLPAHSFKFSGSPDLLLEDIARIRSAV